MTVLPGTEYAGSLPRTAIAGRHALYFKWQYWDQTFTYRGAGRIRIAAPDSAWLDFALSNGQLQSSALLVGAGPIRSEYEDSIARILPSPELVWAAVGRLAVPASSDTIKRIQNGLVRADIGSDPKWRVTFDGQRLSGMEKSVRGRITERVTRAADGAVTYERGRRTTLKFTEVRDSIAAPFSLDIWRN